MIPEPDNPTRGKASPGPAGIAHPSPKTEAFALTAAHCVQADAR